ncbi:hypothetical protein Tco_0203920, partial [Tanacetum coccineum]
VFYVEHRSYKLHECSNSDHNSINVLVCETCSMSMEIQLNNKGGKEEMVLNLEKHEKYGDCDPKKKKKLTCGVRRFQSDHDGKGKNMPAMFAAARVGGGARPFLVSLASRMGQDYGKKNNGSKIMKKKQCFKSLLLFFRTHTLHPIIHFAVLIGNFCGIFSIAFALIPTCVGCDEAGNSSEYVCTN